SAELLASVGESAASLALWQHRRDRTRACVDDDHDRRGRAVSKPHGVGVVVPGTGNLRGRPMNRFVQFQEDGTIVGIVELGDPAEGMTHWVSQTADHDVVELEDDDELRELPSDEIMHRYRVDPESGKVVKR